MLPLGSVVRLKNGTHKLMITCRFPLYNNGGTIGYMDYSGCVYPMGHIDQHAFFFNEENIEEIFFEGYIDQEEEKFLEVAEKQLSNISYPKLHLNDETKNSSSDEETL